jgi:phage host-nuclease inhibitor protein Gam
MAKRLKEIPEAPTEAAEDLLLAIRSARATMAELTASHNTAQQQIAMMYAQKAAPIREALESHEKALVRLMRLAKGSLFAGSDVVNLVNGSLIRNKADKVTIPRDALARCEEQGFEDAIKTVKSLDREAIEKWPDARLVLIGAERKTKEEFSFSVAEGKI